MVAGIPGVWAEWTRCTGVWTVSLSGLGREEPEAEPSGAMTDPPSQSQYVCLIGPGV